MNDLTVLLISVKCRANSAKHFGADSLYIAVEQVQALIKALEAKQPHHNGMMQLSNKLVMAKQRIAELEKAQQPAEPFGFTDGDAHGMVYEPRHADRLANPCPVYRLPPLESKSRTVTAAASDVLAERQRQISAEGWSPEHDDEHVEGQIADAAACYALFATDQRRPVPAHWPWSDDWWKQHGQRRDLVRAGALIIAEIERIDRAAGIQVIEGEASRSVAEQVAVENARLPFEPF